MNDGCVQKALPLEVPTTDDTEQSMAFVSPYPWISDWAAPPRVTKSQWEQMVEIGSLVLPDVHTLREYFRLYFIYCWPQFPVLEESKFRRLYDTLTPSQSAPDASVPTISLTLLKALMFVASPVNILGLKVESLLSSSSFETWRMLLQMDCHLCANYHNNSTLRQR